MIGKGVIVPLLTPVYEDESINYSQLGELVEHVIQGGINAVFAMGTSGEFARFRPEERINVIRKVKELSRGRVPVYAGVSDCGTRLVIENAKMAEAAGADALVATLPYYFPNRSPREAYDFYSRLCRSTKLPVFLYNLPAAIGSNIPIEVVRQLNAEGLICGVKDTSGDLKYFTELLKLKAENDKLSVVVGDESLCYEGFKAGADGVVPSMGNPYPKLWKAIYDSVVCKDYGSLKDLCSIVDRYNQLNSFTDSWMSPNIWRKTALKQFGIMDDYFTGPYNAVDDATLERIRTNNKEYLTMFG